MGRGFVPIEAPACRACGKPVYLAEQIVLDDRAKYHKRCFQCEQCKCQLTALNVAAFDGKIFCKTHFHERLAHAGGKYDKAFRETTEAEEKEGRDKGSSKGDEKKKKKKKDNNNNNNNNKTSVKSMAAKTNASSAKDASKNGCVVCETTVYAAEAVNAVVGNKKVHKRCFKCFECSVTLSLNTFVFDKETAKLYCKTHTPKMKAHVGLDGVYGLQKAETKVSHLGGRQVMPKVEEAPKVTIGAIVGYAQPDLRSFSVGRNVMPGNEPQVVTLKNNNSNNNKENKAEKKPEPVDYTSPNATPSSTKKAEKEKKVFTLETPPLTTSVEKKKKERHQKNADALEERKQEQQQQEEEEEEAQKQAEKTSHEMSIKKSRSGSRSPSESLTSVGSEDIAKKQLIEALSGVSIKEEKQDEDNAGTPATSSAGTHVDEKRGDPYAGMTKSQIKKAKEREKMRAKEQLKYEKDLEKQVKELEMHKKKRAAALASSSASSLSASAVRKVDPTTEPVKVQEIVEQIEPPKPPPPEPSNFYLIKPPGAKDSSDDGELQSKGYELDGEGKLVQSPSFSGSEPKEKPIQTKKKKKSPAEKKKKFLAAKSEVSMSEEGSKMFQAPPKVPSGTAPTGATKGEKVGPDADLNTLKGNKVSPRRAIGHIAPEPISSPTVTAPSAEVISNSPGSSSKKGNKNQKVKLGEAVELEEEKPKLQNAQVYSFKELQESGFAFDDENDIDLSDYNSESYESESIGTPKTAEVREAEPATPSTMNITSTTPFS